VQGLDFILLKEEAYSIFSADSNDPCCMAVAQRASQLAGLLPQCGKISRRLIAQRDGQRSSRSEDPADEPKGAEDWSLRADAAASCCTCLRSRLGTLSGLVKGRFMDAAARAPGPSGAKFWTFDSTDRSVTSGSGCQEVP